MLLDRGGLLGLATAALYLWLAPTHAVDGDSAEFATLGAIGGVAHPSGYPLYVLLLRALAWLPGSPAHAAALATALIGAAAVVAVHAACRAWGARPLAATVAAALFATGPAVLRIHTEPEVFALANLVVAVVLLVAARHGPLRGCWRAGALGVVAGLGLANHLTCVLVAPVGLYGVVRAAREAGAARALVTAAGGLALGLAPYLYVLIAPDTPMSWGTVDGLGGVVALISRRDYGGATAFGGMQSVSAWTSLGALAVTLARAYLWLGLALAVGGFGWGCARAHERGETRLGWALLALAVVLAGPLLVTRFDVAPEGVGLYVVRRFHVLPVLLVAPAVALAIDVLIGARLAGSRAAIAIAATLGVAAGAAPSLGYVARVHGPAVERCAQNLLRSLPDGAVVLESADYLHAGTAYVQWALGDRQDVVVVTRGMLGFAWYRDRLARRGFVVDDRVRAPIVAAVERVLAGGRRVFVDLAQQDVLAALPTRPYGLVVEVLPRGARAPGLDEVVAQNRALYAAYVLDYPRPGGDDEYAAVIHRRYAATWELLARALAGAGRRDDAAAAHATARALAPE